MVLLWKDVANSTVKAGPCVSSGNVAAKAQWGPWSEQVQNSDRPLMANGAAPDRARGQLALSLRLHSPSKGPGQEPAPLPSLT